MIHPAEKLCKSNETQKRIGKLKRPLVFTNGVFDILHRGHVEYLYSSSQLGKSLIVALNTDESVKLLAKGRDRPVNLLQDRMVVIASLFFVDLVLDFSEQTPMNLLASVKPDVYVKGGDYVMESLEETKLVRSWGGEAVAMPFISGYSTTAMIERIRSVES